MSSLRDAYKKQVLIGSMGLIKMNAFTKNKLFKNENEEENQKKYRRKLEVRLPKLLLQEMNYSKMEMKRKIEKI